MGDAVALEATGNWYWIVGEIEAAGLRPLLVHPRKAKLMMGMINKTDKLDVHELNRLRQTGTLPTVWIPPADLRELTRTRLVLVTSRTRLKNRLLTTLAKYGFRWMPVTTSAPVRANNGRSCCRSCRSKPGLSPGNCWNNWTSWNNNPSHKPNGCNPC